MFHKNVLNAPPAISGPAANDSEQSSYIAPRLMLVPPGGGSTRKTSSSLADLISISAHRCSAFLAEAAVLVLVLAVLDRFMLKGHLEFSWILTALAISLVLLAASVATEFTARRWLTAH